MLFKKKGGILYTTLIWQGLWWIGIPVCVYFLIHIFWRLFVILQSVTKTRVQQADTLSYRALSKYANEDQYPVLGCRNNGCNKSILLRINFFTYKLKCRIMCSVHYQRGELKVNCYTCFMTDLHEIYADIFVSLKAFLEMSFYFQTDFSNSSYQGSLKISTEAPNSKHPYVPDKFCMVN